MSRTGDEIEPKSDEIFRLGNFVFKMKTKQLQGLDGKVQPLRNQSGDVLAVLMENSGTVVSKDQLINTVWGDTFVTDDSLVQCIADIRRVLRDEDHALVQTFPKKGYRVDAEPHPDPDDKIAAVLFRGGTQVAGRDPRMIARYLMAALILAGLVIYFLTRPNAPDETAATIADDMPRIAVLPFDDFSAGADKGYLSDAIAEGIITEMARSRWIDHLRLAGMPE